MVYFLKFCASWILPPGIFIVIFMAIAVRLWRKRREKKLAALLAMVTLVFYLLCTNLVANKTMVWLEDAYTPPNNPQGDVIIMLGGGAFANTPDVDGQGTLAGAPANRLLTVARLQRQLNIPVLLSGGQVFADSGPEAKIAKRILISLGVPENMILTETKSINTTQNAKFSAAILREEGLKSPILVTSAFHMKRSVLNFAKQGIAVTAYPADYQVNHQQVFHYTKLMPSTEAFLNNVTVMQETLRTFVTRYIE